MHAHTWQREVFYCSNFTICTFIYKYTKTVKNKLTKLQSPGSNSESLKYQNVLRTELFQNQIIN